MEVIHRNVRPRVRCQVVGDAARARHVRVQLGLPVMRLDLRGQRIPRQAQALHEGTSQRRPIRARHRHDVRGPRARRAVDLAQVLRGLDARDLAGQAVREHRHFLADRHRRRRLAVRVRQHRDGRPGLGETAQAIQERADRGQPHLLGRSLDGQRVRQVVDVLGGAENMDDLAQGRQRRALTQLAGRGLQVFADQVFDSLDVVAGDGLELAQALDVLGAEIAGERAQVVALRVRQRRCAWQDRVVKQENQPLDFDVHARAVQARLGQVVR